MANAELVRMEAVRVDQFEKELNVDSVQLKGRSSHYSFTRKTVEEIQTELDAITFPEGGDIEALRTYIRAISKATEGTRSWRHTDRQIAMLQKVGSEHLDLLVEEYSHSYHLRTALPKMVDSSHKDFVIQHLDEFPWLAGSVLKHEWSEAARDILIRGIARQSDNLNTEWFKAVAAFEDPSTYDDLVTYFVQQDHNERTYRVLKQINGIDLDKAVARAWKTARYGYDYEVRYMIPIAIAHGHIDALGQGIENYIVDAGSNSHSKKQIRNVVKKHTGLTGSDEEIAAWFKDNKEALTFDKGTGMYQANAE